jgi:uncharacterized protein (DUF1499 family)
MRVARWALGASVFALLLLAVSGPAVRLGAPFLVGILLLPIAGLFGLIGALLALFGLFRPRAIVALVLGLAVAAVPVAGYVKARSAPPINDISTDSTAELQRKAYPDLQPQHLQVPPNIAFERAKGAAQALGWDLVREDPSAGRIEAVATTFWFGFKDDVVVRVSAEGSGSRVDVRSKSRVGTGDLGTNAQRIRAFQEHLK